MELIEAIEGRKSIRAFKPDPVPRKMIENILQLAIKAPSAINLQPWEFTVVGGKEKQRLCRRLLKAYSEKRVSCSPKTKSPLPPEVQRRRRKLFHEIKPYIGQLGVPFEDFINEGSFDFYGAPTAIIISMDRAFPKTRLVCIGAVLGYLVLAARAHGLGTCPIGIITAFEDEIKDQLNIPEGKEVILGLALGYPDWENPINRFKSSREKPANITRWLL
ncbi:MAG: nitroreductase [Syntrophobacterales bacterium]|nr:MAG: nitroreductase [Syntrophobacterales bacterium]